ncbi:MAG TPA: hypothetical protein VFB45_14120 [Pseudolabrys sp.]|nr:hypothetical protein [Pseudolabrys sp.]
MRLLNIVVIAALVVAAVWVYKIKFDSTLQVERVAKLRGEIRRERDAIATLRAEWSRLDTPGRVEALAHRFLQLRQVQPHQIDNFEHLPERPPTIVQPPSDDPIGAMIDPEDAAATGSVGPAKEP